MTKRAKLNAAELIDRLRALREECQDLRDDVIAHCRAAAPLQEAEQAQRLAVTAAYALSELAVGLYGTIEVTRSAEALRVKP